MLTTYDLLLAKKGYLMDDALKESKNPEVSHNKQQENLDDVKMEFQELQERDQLIISTISLFENLLITKCTLID